VYCLYRCPCTALLFFRSWQLTLDTAAGEPPQCFECAAGGGRSAAAAGGGAFSRLLGHHAPVWRRYWWCLRAPYLHCYADYGERQPVSSIDLRQRGVSFDQPKGERRAKHPGGAAAARRAPTETEQLGWPVSPLPRRVGDTDTAEKVRWFDWSLRVPGRGVFMLMCESKEARANWTSRVERTIQIQDVRPR
jgi:hypothetical protein